MRTPRFWYWQRGQSKASLLSDILLPFSLCFRAGTFLRRVTAKPYRAKVPVICVGNAVAGGAGKTPTSLALARILKERGQHPVFVTRGYGGNGQLACVDPATHKVEDVGDEALLLAAAAPTWACRDRVQAMRSAEGQGAPAIMDDGLQNPHIQPTYSILVIDGDVGVGNGRVLPAGPLREPLADALDRVVAVIIIGSRDRQNLAAQANVPVFRARLKPSLPKGFPTGGKFIAFAGIARPEKFFATAQAAGLELAGTYGFADHHVYSEDEINALRLHAEETGARLLTTAKDAVRLSPAVRAEVLVLSVDLVFEDPTAEASLAKLVGAA